MPLNEANGPSDTLICSPTSYSNLGFGLSTPSVISCKSFETSLSDMAIGLSLVPKKFASRIKRLQVLKQAVQLGYIDEETSKSDRRRRIYKPSEQMISDFYEYADNAVTDI